MTRKRILIVGLNFHPEPISTGKYTSELAAYLAEHEFSVRTVTAPPYYPWWRVQLPHNACRYQREVWQNVMVWRCPVWVPARPAGITRILHLFSFALTSFPVLLAQIRWKPDVVMGIAPTFLSAPAVWLTARVSGGRAWLHIQDFELEAARQLGLFSPLRPFFAILLTLEGAMLRRFDRVSTISQRMQERLHEKGVAPRQTLLLPNWVDTRQIYPLPVRERTLRAEWGIGEEEVVALYSGNFGYKQGLETLMAAARMVQSERHIRFILCGEGAMRTELERQAAALPNVRLYPLQPAERLNLLLNSADIHLLPQRADAADLVMPSKLAGMLASGKAVIASARPGTELYHVVSQTGVVVAPDDASALAQAIRRLAEDRQYRQSLGQKGRQWVEAHWAKDIVLPAFLNRLQDL